MILLIAAASVGVALAFAKLGALLVWMKVLTAAVQLMACVIVVLSSVLLGRHLIPQLWRR